KQQTHKLYAHSISADMSHGDTIQGDFNGDGKPEYLWVDSGRYRETMKCKDKQCKIKACCSNKNIPALVTNRDYDTGIYGMRAI
ncbi:MAG TPA: hypothetical protein VD905_18470, partial [Flavobacteriales bacterium]|nr:hypothetical protein [Flavobacteriales bacterium]